MSEINRIIQDLEFCDSVFDYTLTPDDSGLLLGYIKQLQQENQQLKEALDKAIKQSVTDHKYASECEDKVITYKSVLDEIRDRATIRLARLENEPDYCKYYLEGYDRAITVNRASNSGVAMEWVKNTMITECKDLLEILDKVKE